MYKVYYQMNLKQISPLRIGNAINEISDNDMMLDGRGVPFVPGTSLAGIMRHQIEKYEIDEIILNRLFGRVDIAKDKATEPVSETSAIIVGDATISNSISDSDFEIGHRDGVGLNEWGTAIAKSKFDFQIAECGNKYCSIIEWSGDEEQYKSEVINILDPLMNYYINKGIQIGARTSRGYGQFEVEVNKLVFSFPRDINKWLEFNPYSDNAFNDSVKIEGEWKHCDNEIEIAIKMVSPFSVRVNTARTELLEDGTVPDNVPMENSKGNPVIPGTSWAGAFRHHMHSLLRDAGIYEDADEMKKLDEIFGVSLDKSSIRKSQISFSETEIIIADKQTQNISLMRNSIDRFTAAPRNTALFTERVYIGGRGKLNICFDDKDIPDMYKELLSACIVDLDLGLLTVGGEASIGRGIMQIEDIKFNGMDIYTKMKSSIEKGCPLNWLM